MTIRDRPLRTQADGRDLARRTQKYVVRAITSWRPGTAGRYAPAPSRVALATARGDTGAGVAHGHVPRRRGAGCRVGEGRLDLSAKFAPPAPAGLARGRLLDLAAHRVVLVLAPAGHGKTTLLGQIASRFPGTVVWYRIDAADRDPAELAGRIGRALGKAGLAGDCRSFDDVAAALDAAGPRPAARLRRLPRRRGLGGRARPRPDDRARATDAAGGARRAPGRRAGRAGAAGLRRRARRRRRRPAVPVLGGRAAVPRDLPPAAAARGRRDAVAAHRWLGGRARDVPPAHRGPPTRTAAAGAGRPVPRIAAGALLPRPRGARRPACRAARVPAPHQRPGGADRHPVRRAARRPPAARPSWRSWSSAGSSRPHRTTATSSATTRCCSTTSSWS